MTLLQHRVVFFNKKLQLHLYLKRSFKSRGGEVLPYKKGGDACREISNEPLKGTNLGVA